MESCSRQCIRRTFYAVIVGTSPIVLCLFLIAVARIILHQVETAYHRRQKLSDRRRSSSVYHQTGRPTLLYTPISMMELQRIIQGQQSVVSAITQVSKPENTSPKTSKFMKSILTRRDPSPPPSTDTLANLVIRRNALSSTPMTALLTPGSMSSFNIINEQKSSRPGAVMRKNESIETTTSAALNNNNNNNDFFTATNSFDCEQIELNSLPSSPRIMTKTMTSTVVVEEFQDFHSVRSVPYSLNLINPIAIERNV